MRLRLLLFRIAFQYLEYFNMDFGIVNSFLEIFPFCTPTPSPGEKVAPKGSEEECGRQPKDSHNATDLHSGWIQNSNREQVFVFQIIKNHRPHSSSVSCADSLPPGEAIWVLPHQLTRVSLHVFPGKMTTRPRVVILIFRYSPAASPSCPVCPLPSWGTLFYPPFRRAHSTASRARIRR